MKTKGIFQHTFKNKIKPKRGTKRAWDSGSWSFPTMLKDSVVRLTSNANIMEMSPPLDPHIAETCGIELVP